MKWDFRVLKTDKGCELIEVYYNEDGYPTGYVPCNFVEDSVADLQEYYELVGEAFSKGVLLPESFLLLESVPMQVEVDADVVDKLVVRDLRWHYDNMLEPIPNIPHYSSDPDEEKKQVKKMLKAFKKVINYYSTPSEQIE